MILDIWIIGCLCHLVFWFFVASQVEKDFWLVITGTILFSALWPVFTPFVILKVTHKFLSK